MFITEQEIYLIESQYPGLMKVFNQKTIVDTPDGRASIDSFATMGIKIDGELQREVDAKFVFEEDSYNYFNVYQSKKDKTYHFGFVITPIGDGTDEPDFKGIWKLGVKNYSKEEFENEFQRVLLRRTV